MEADRSCSRKDGNISAIDAVTFVPWVSLVCSDKRD